MSAAPLLVVEGLETCYGGIAALRGISFEVAAGSVVALVGANGAGKSTTLNTISGLLAPRAGSIRFEGREIGGWRADRVASLGLVQVPEGRQVLAPLTVEENLLLGAYTAPRPRGPSRPGGHLRALPAPGRAPRSSSPARSPAASSRCWRSGGR